MFPDPGTARRRSHHSGSHLSAAEGRAARARPDARARRSHRRRCRTSRRYVDGPIYGTPLTLALVEPKLQEHGLDGAACSCRSAPRQRVTVGPFEIEFIRVTHSMPDCVALAIHTPGGRRRPHRRLQDRPDADRRRALRRPPLRRARRRRRAGAVRRQHQHRSPRLHRLGARGRRSLRGNLHQRQRQADRRGVRVEHLPDADPRRPGGAVRSQASRSSAAA